MSQNNSFKSTEQTTNEKPKKNRALTYVILIIILVVISFLIYRENEKLKNEIDQKDLEIEKTYLQLDSVSKELDQRIAIIQDLNANADSIGNLLDTLQALKAQLESDKLSLLKEDSKKKQLIAELNERLDGYTQLLNIKDQEILKISQLNEELVEENVVLKEEKVELNKTVEDLKVKETELQAKVDIASQLKAVNVVGIAVNARGKERQGEFRNRHVEQLKVTFTLLENEVAPIEGKEILLRIIGPDNQVLFDVEKGSGSFFYKGRELFYTLGEKILYKKKKRDVTFMYDKGNDYDLGLHKIEAYTDGYLLGAGEFNVK